MRMKETEGWVEIRSVMDSGAGAPVAPRDIAPNVVMKESDGSRRGQKFISASLEEMEGWTAS